MSEHALAPLRPTEEQALDAWRQLIDAEAAQVGRVREPEPAEDFYAPVAQRFRPGVRESVELEALLDLVDPGDTWLDIGAGGGRLTVPIAQRVQRVIAVDPSDSMRSTLAAAAEEAGVKNIDIRDGRWPVPAWSDDVDVSLAAHAMYDIRDIGPFLDAMERHSRRLCVAAFAQFGRGTQFARLFEELHGEPYISLPALKEFVAILGARNRRYDVRTVGSAAATELAEPDAAYEFVRRIMWLAPGSAKDQRMRHLVDQWYGTPEGIATPVPRRFIGIVWWEPPER